MLEKDEAVARSARKAIGKAMQLLTQSPFSCRKAHPDNPFLRELVISFGASGYVALYEIESDQTVTILAVRHQFEDDYH
jgi:plasmid stabilization system protein ParE